MYIYIYEYIYSIYLYCKTCITCIYICAFTRVYTQVACAAMDTSSKCRMHLARHQYVGPRRVVGSPIDKHWRTFHELRHPKRVHKRAWPAPLVHLIPHFGFAYHSTREGALDLFGIHAPVVCHFAATAHPRAMLQANQKLFVACQYRLTHMHPHIHTPHTTHTFMYMYTYIYIYICVGVHV